MEDTILRTVLMKNFIDFRPRILDSLSGYNIKLFGQDSMAGIIVALVAALPLALAFAIASGASPEVGLISAIVGGFIIAVLSGCCVCAFANLWYTRCHLGNSYGWYYSDGYGCFQARFAHSLYSISRCGWIYIRYGCNYLLYTG